MSLSKTMIIGKLGADPELKYTPSGAAVCNFSVATDESYTDKSGTKQEKTEWHRIVVWGKLAELCNQYLSKGKQAYIEGKNSTRSWDDKDGNKRYTTEINAHSVQFLSPKSEGATTGSNDSPAANTPVADSAYAASDIPF
jgi:single-strand DNA-binding protein